jgi:hypothetical protein
VRVFRMRRALSAIHGTISLLPFAVRQQYQPLDFFSVV